MKRKSLKGKIIISFRFIRYDGDEIIRSQTLPWNNGSSSHKSLFGVGKGINDKLLPIVSI